ncbi:recombinase RecT [Pectinatus frisingensis]|uniref:recombinase RecT n=1 Tax=Pectinatus frisingensis TaxID=865 RepID=UPI0018C7857E|nr:recombinase RecT [Pectinatus frisingensis]
MATTRGGIIKTAHDNNVSAINGVKSIKDLVISMKSQIEKALPSVMTGERFSRMVLTAMSANPQLQQCSPKSFLGAMMQAAQLGVEPNTPLGQAYLIPYRNKGNLECQFQLGYKGLLDLAYRSGEVTIIQAHEVCEHDVFEYEFGLEPKLKHIPALRDKGAVTHYYAMFKTKSSGYGFHVMSADEVREHAKQYSKSANNSYSPWTTNFDEMAKKTVLKACLKYAPVKTEFVRGISADETIKSNISDSMVAENDETTYDDINVDIETGEIKEDHTEDDRILEESIKDV